MDDESTVRGPQHFILLRRYGEQETREYHAWNSELPTLFPGKIVRFGNIHDAVDDARKAAVAGKDYELELNLKVAEGTALDTEDVLALIEANGGPDGLDLTGCELEGVDLSRDTIARERADYVERNGVEPLWFSDRSGGIFLWRSQLAGVRLAYAQLEGADLRLTNFDNANLYQANLRAANLLQARLRRAHLAEAQFQEAHLEQTQLQGAFVRGTQFQRANLRWAELQGVDFYSVGSLDAVRWYGAFLDHTRMRREQLGDAIGDEIAAHNDKAVIAYFDAGEAYLLLKNNFLSLGRYDDAASSYIKERQMEKMAYHWGWRDDGWPWSTWRGFSRWFRNWVYELLAGYGQRPWNPVIAGGVTVLAFAIGFWATRAISNFWDALIYSLATFATFNLADLQPEGRGVDIASSVEALLGITVLALVVFTLGSRMSRS